MQTETAPIKGVRFKVNLGLVWKGRKGRVGKLKSLVNGHVFVPQGTRYLR